MEKMSDLELIDEIRQRFEFNRKALGELRALTTKLEVMNEKLQESEAVKSQFLSNIRNEINNPLSAIMGLAGQCAADDADGALRKSHAAMIFSEAFNLDFQLQNIFMAAELEAGEAEPAFANADINTIAASCIEKLKHRIEEKEIRLDYSPAELAECVIDAGKVALILLNLLANAVEFAPSRGLVTLKIRSSEGADLMVVVEDNGPGIDPAHRETVFDRFRQLEAGMTKSHRGHGLGLSLCRSLSEILGGRLTLDSAAAQGARFTVELPRPDLAVETMATEGNAFLFEPCGKEEIF